MGLDDVMNGFKTVAGPFQIHAAYAIVMAGLLFSGTLKDPSWDDLFGRGYMVLFYLHAGTALMMMLQYWIQEKTRSYICGAWLDMIYTIIIQGAYLYVQVIVVANMDNSNCYDVYAVEYIWIILDVLTYYMNILTPILMMTLGLIHGLLKGGKLIDTPIDEAKNVFEEDKTVIMTIIFVQMFVSLFVMFFALFNWSASAFLVLVFLVNTGLHCVEGIACMTLIANDYGEKLFVTAIASRALFIIFLIAYIFINLDLFHTKRDAAAIKDGEVNSTGLMMAWLTAEVVLFFMLFAQYLPCACFKRDAPELHE